MVRKQGRSFWHDFTYFQCAWRRQKLCRGQNSSNTCCMQNDLNLNKNAELSPDPAENLTSRLGQRYLVEFLTTSGTMELWFMKELPFCFVSCTSTRMRAQVQCTWEHTFLPPPACCCANPQLEVVMHEKWRNMPTEAGREGHTAANTDVKCNIVSVSVL